MELNSSIAAVVTGGASGLCEATARALAQQGVKVAIFDLQKDKSENVAADIGGIWCEVNVGVRPWYSSGIRRLGRDFLLQCLEILFYADGALFEVRFA